MVSVSVGFMTGLSQRSSGSVIHSPHNVNCDKMTLQPQKNPLSFVSLCETVCCWSTDLDTHSPRAEIIIDNEILVNDTEAFD